ncbi:hypothetical protein EGT49_09230 [Companilactobacillus suantsaicola]|uniref:Uncharacterized protein n=1 Tax=Companilactobacillus suantsaicola TaxID=2487723 RepID=A0A4Z0JH76_9LACO|nr:hypothetical protein [Companilactobacillus suantsaicola]TGD22317.1 hypothetical protein EGT49_09230 [Companilactobacillus suantsaicola]
MIFLNVPAQQDKIIELLNNYDQDGLTFDFVDKKGLKLRFKTNATDLDAAAKTAKAAVKAEVWGSMLSFQAGFE